MHVDREGCRRFCFGCHRGGGIGALLDELGEPHPPARRQRHRGRVGPRLAITLSGNRSVEVVGESHHQDALLAVSGGGRRQYGGVKLEAVAELLSDRDNVYDRNAVEVRLDGLTMGHLSREDALELRPLVEAPTDLRGNATAPP